MKKIFTLIALFSLGGIVAQDVHFSQYWATPLALNPAFTGKFNGALRATFDYRNQFFTTPTTTSGEGTYQTYQASVDGNVLPTRRTQNRLGVGGMFFSDKAGDGALQTNTGMVSIAYHQSVSRYGRTHISFGMSAGVVNKRINMRDLIFETQLDGFGWNRNLANGENYSGKSITYADVTAGFLLTSRPKNRFAFNLGYSMHHISRPRESFIGDQDNRLPILHVVNAGCEFIAGYDKEWTIAPTFLFMMQAMATQYNIGVSVNYQTTNENIGVFWGAYTRVMDVAIVNVGMELWNTRIGVSYDFVYSKHVAATQGHGAAEVSLVYILHKKGESPIYYENYCPKF